MSLVRIGMLILAAWGALTATAIWAPDLASSGQRVVVTAVVALVAPLVWPGLAPPPGAAVVRIARWSIAAAAVAGAVLWLCGGPRQSFVPVLVSTAFLLGLLLPSHALAALLEARWHRTSLLAKAAREMAGRTTALTLALLGTVPLWLGPLGELLSRDHEWVIDALIAASPLTHLAVASGNDLLRNQWLYQHSNLASLPFSYPGLRELALVYGAGCTLLLATLAWQHHVSKHSSKEKTP